MVKGEHETDEVSGTVLDRQILSSAQQDPNIGMRRLLGDRDLVIVDLDARHISTPLGERAGELAVTGADIDDREAIEIDQRREMIQMIHRASPACHERSGRHHKRGAKEASRPPWSHLASMQDLKIVGGLREKKIEAKCGQKIQGSRP
jgi:hypothetical protein